MSYNFKQLYSVQQLAEVPEQSKLIINTESSTKQIATSVITPDDYITQDIKDQPNGIATLDETGKIKAEQIIPLNYFNIIAGEPFSGEGTQVSSNIEELNFILNKCLEEQKEPLQSDIDKIIWWNEEQLPGRLYCTYYHSDDDEVPFLKFYFHNQGYSASYSKEFGWNLAFHD